MKKILPVSIFIWGLLFPGMVQASCSVSASTLYPIPYSNNQITLNVANIGSSPINWINIPVGFTSSWMNVTFEMLSSGWEQGTGGSGIMFFGGNLSPGESVSIRTTGDTGAQGENIYWGLSSSPNNDGSEMEACNTLEFLVTNTPPLPTPTPTATPAPSTPVLSALSVTAGATTATVSWRSDTSAKGSVSYGVSSEYGTLVEGESDVYSNSILLTGLTPSTTYHFTVSSTSENGTTTSSDNTFTTGLLGTTTTVTTTVTNVVTNNVTTTSTTTLNKIITDTTPPSLKIDKLDKRVYESAPLVSGSVSDDRGVAKVEFKIKNREASWSGASLDKEVGVKKTAFEFLPPLSLDGTYEIEVRGIDVFGNISVPKSVIFVIDKMMPTVGGGVISYGALPMYARDGIVEVIEGLEYEVVLYEEGGADNVEIEIANHKFSNSQMGARGLWRSLIKFEEIGEFRSKVRAVDGANNETEREWVKFKVVPRGRVEAQFVRVFWLDPTTKRYQLWDGAEYGAQDFSNNLGLVLPSGDYYLEAEKDGVKTISQKISLENTTNIYSDWELGQTRWWERLLKIRRLDSIPVSHYSSTPVKHSLGIGRELWIGKKSVVYIGTKELPWYSETLQRAQAWARSEGAQMVELPAKIDDKYGLLPQVYLVNDKGDIQDMKEGVWER